MAKKTKQEAQQERLSLVEKRNRQERRNKKSRKEREQEKRRKKQERDRRKQKKYSYNCAAEYSVYSDAAGWYLPGDKELFLQDDSVL